MPTRPRTLLANAGRLSDSRSVKSKPTELPQQQPITPITLSVNTVFDGKFIPAGEVLPVSSTDDLPESLKPFVVVTSDQEPEAEEEATANYQLNTVYMMTEDARRGRMLHRQVAQMEAQAEQEEWAIEQLSQPLAPEIADALEDQHVSHIGASKARAQYAAEERDHAQEVAQKFIDGEDQEVNEL